MFNAGYWVELTCQVETGMVCVYKHLPEHDPRFTGLFTLTSVGLIPWRILDTWRQNYNSATSLSLAYVARIGIYWIWYYKRKTIRLRKRLGIPQLTDLDDLPDPVVCETLPDLTGNVLTPFAHTVR